MSSDVERAPVQTPSRIGQGTAIEQAARAAEVYAAVQVAQQVPRDITHAIAEMTQSCAQMELAERAFYRYNRGGSQVSGPSVHLARELARCFRNVQYGIAELRRDDEFRQSEMQAYAWDVENNTRAATIFIVPHKRDKKTGVENLVELRDVYENNANNGARRLRQQIFAILPPWFVQQAITLCTNTLETGGKDAEPLPQRIAKAVEVAAKWGVTKAQLEDRLARKSKDWTAPDLAQLLVVFQSLQRGEVTVADEFPQERVTAAELTGKTKPATKRADDDPTAAQGFGEQLPVEDPPGDAG